MNWRVNLLNFWRYNRAILGVADPEDAEFAVPVSDTAPLPVRVVGGNPGGGGTGTPTQTISLSRIALALTAQAQALPNIPAGATGARVSVEGGVARVATAAPDPTPADGERWPDGSVWEVSGRTDLLAFRAVTASGNPKLQITYTQEQ
ncbi:hypothetical protein DEIPH_ctg052orf0001 [Deinococcus phoenicis]|uniref:Uncharacterized protein n=1 Tax=Deinococcus phoenicis TaxID=1476583 RepID=A0A016QM01_9DEIO|nr:hypothetical protein [Deinococcus phoenicis]EYB67011.1 hypothetical protein DEIPH_ctg052orf0001 [Deinococcus phoenicis]